MRCLDCPLFADECPVSFYKLIWFSKASFERGILKSTLVGIVSRGDRPSRHSNGRAYMRKHDDFILGQVHVCLDGVDASLDSSSECAHSVFGMLSLVSSVGYRLRHLFTIFTLPGKSPTSYASLSARSGA